MNKHITNSKVSPDDAGWRSPKLSNHRVTYQFVWLQVYSLFVCKTDSVDRNWTELNLALDSISLDWLNWTTSVKVPFVYSVLMPEIYGVLLENAGASCPSFTLQLIWSFDILDILFSCCRSFLAFAVSDDLSFGGTYTGKEPMGLLWSMRPVLGSRKGLR